MKIDLKPKTKYNPIFSVVYLMSVILGVVVLPWQTLLVSYLIFAFIMTFGIGFGTHRIYIHRTVDVPNWIKPVIVYVSAITNTGSIMTWGMSHYLHHTKTDTVDDPHTPIIYGLKVLFGFYATDEIMKSGNKVFAAVKHIARDKFASNVHRYYYAYVASWPLLMLVLFGWSGFLAYGLMPTGLAYIALHMFNYFCHQKWAGYRNHDTNDESQNVMFLFPLILGEHLHNNHHRFPSKANLQERWWEIDPTYVWIWLFNTDNHSKWKIKTKLFFMRFKRNKSEETDYIY